MRHDIMVVAVVVSVIVVEAGVTVDDAESQARVQVDGMPMDVT